jgi:hypothetical protein
MIVGPRSIVPASSNLLHLMNIRDCLYCHVSADPWLIITDSGLDDWIYWHLFLQSPLIKITYRNSDQSSAEDSLHSRSHPHSTTDCSLRYTPLCPHSLGSLELRNSTTARDFPCLIKLRHGPRRKHLYYFGVFSARCIATSTARTTENTAYLSLAAWLLQRVYWTVA